MSRKKDSGKKDLAYQLFLTTDLTQERIAEIVGTTNVTISNWAKADGWDEIKGAYNSTHGAIIKGLYRQLAELNKAIEARAEGYRYPHPEEVKTMQTINNTIRTMSKELNIANYATVFKELSNYILGNLGKAKAEEFTNIQVAFLKAKYKSI